jgi:hypothetical protein
MKNLMIMVLTQFGNLLQDGDDEMVNSNVAMSKRGELPMLSPQRRKPEIIFKTLLIDKFEFRLVIVIPGI